MLKIEDLIRKAIIIDEPMFWDSHHLLKLKDSHHLLKLMKEIPSLATQDFWARNKIQMISIYRYIDV